LSPASYYSQARQSPAQQVKNKEATLHFEEETTLFYKTKLGK